MSSGIRVAKENRKIQMENYIKWRLEKTQKERVKRLLWWQSRETIYFSVSILPRQKKWNSNLAGYRKKLQMRSKFRLLGLFSTPQLRSCSPLTCHQWDQNLFLSLLGHSVLQPAVNYCHRHDSGWAAAGEHTTSVCHQSVLGQTCLHKKQGES